jgi:FKBP-type peptidyl-prolyl cis-trans isomerase
MNIGASIKKNNISLDPDLLGKGATTALAGGQPLLTMQEVMAVLKSLPAGPTNLPAGDKNFKEVKEEVGYAIGMNFGQAMKSQGVELDVATLVKGLKDTLAGGATLLTTNEETDVFTALRAKLQEKQAAQMKEQTALMKEQGDLNLQEGPAFLAKNKGEPGVITLTNGLQYKIITAGTGPKPKLTDTVNVNYRGTLVSGLEFDASAPGSPISFPLTGVIRGWTEILQLMPAGSKWKVFIPSDLAYGERGFPPKIAPNATLIFEIELLSIEPPPASPPAPPK